MSTALQVIEDAFRKATITAVGDTLTAEECNDALRALNDILENLSLERQSVYARSTQQFTATAGQATYSIGPGGLWNTTRPVSIDDVGYARLLGVDYALHAIDQGSYNLLVLKTQPGVPSRFLYVNDAPLGTVTLWPVPDQTYTIGLQIDRVLTSISDLQTVLAFPPGYELALKCLLAEVLAPEYGVALPAAVADQAQRFKADIKRNNRRGRTARFGDMPGVVNGLSTDWRAGV